MEDCLDELVGSPVSGLIRGVWGMGIGWIGYVVGCHLHGYHVIV